VAIPIAERHIEYLDRVAATLRERGIRAQVDRSDDRMQKKIRNAQTQKVPYMLLAGDRDMEQGAVSFRYRSGEQKNGVPIEEAVAEIVSAVERRIQI
jgi:threonyl-tRNA synthetase